MKPSPMASLLLLFLLLSLSLFSSSSSSAVASSATLLAAASTLSNSGYLHMALTLQLASAAGIDLPSPTATIFAPPDTVFLQSGSPSQLLLQYHISPRRISVQTLAYLHHGIKIPTLLPTYSLTVTSSPASELGYSINHVRIDPNLVLDDGSVIIYSIDRFFDSCFYEAPPPSPVAPIGVVPGHLHRPFGSVAELLRSKGYSIMASFLDAQLIGYNRNTALTVFAAVDDAVQDYLRTSSDYSLIFREHVVPSLLTWQDLTALDDGTMLPTFEEGFMINVIKMGEVPVLNEVPVTDQDLYQSRFLVVHGINRLLTSQQQMPTPEEPPVGDQGDGGAGFGDGFVANVADQIKSQDLDDYH